VIFSPDLAAKITLGTKTVTRRPVKRDRASHALPCTYQTGRTYAIQLHRGGIGIDRIRVLDVSRETIELPLSWTEARAEGFISPSGFAERWEDALRRRRTARRVARSSSR